MLDTVPWTLFYTDSFDREMPPQNQATGAGFLSACTALWQRTLQETIIRPDAISFTRFGLQFHGEKMGLDGRLAHLLYESSSVYVDPSENPELWALRTWMYGKSGPSLLEAVAERMQRMILHELEEPDPDGFHYPSRKIIELIAGSQDEGAFRAALRAPLASG